MHLLGERLKVPGGNCPLAVKGCGGTVSEGREEMSVVIIGGHERMERQYQEICRSYGCTAKVYTKENGAMKKKIGSPDLLICFSSTVSHKMVKAVKQQAGRSGVPVEHCGSSSGSALAAVLAKKGLNLTGGGSV